METSGTLAGFVYYRFGRLLFHGYLSLGFHRLTVQACCWSFTMLIIGVPVAPASLALSFLLSRTGGAAEAQKTPLV